MNWSAVIDAVCWPILWIVNFLLCQTKWEDYIALQSIAFLLFLSWFSCLVSTSTLITLFSVLSFINLSLWDSIYYIFSYVLRLAIERMWLMQKGTGRHFWLGRRNWMLLYTDKSDTNIPEINNIYTLTYAVYKFPKVGWCSLSSFFALYNFNCLFYFSSDPIFFLRTF